MQPNEGQNMNNGMIFHNMTPFDNINDHEFTTSDMDPSAHHSLSPYSMNIGTLSRPASLASMPIMALPAGNNLSRVGSMQNMQNLIQQTSIPMYSNFYFPPNYGMHPGGQQAQQQQVAQQMHIYQPFATLGSTDFRLPPELMVPQKPAMAKNQKKKTKRASDSTDAYVPKMAKFEDGSDKKEEKIKAPRSRQPSSVYRGVSKCSKDGRWQARIRVKRQVTYLGRFVNEVDAARKYDEAARQHHGERAVLNFPTAEDKQLGRKQATATNLGVEGGVADADADSD